MCCNWDLLLSSCVYWIWRLDITQEALLFESSCFIFEAKASHFGGEGEYKLAEWGDCGVICQNVLMIILAQLVLNTVEKERIYLLCMFGVICGKEKISVWEMAFGYSAHHQQSVNIFDGIVRTSLKRTNRDGGVAHCLDPTSPPRLMSNEQSL